MNETRFAHAVLALLSVFLLALYASLDLTIARRKNDDFARALRARREYENYIDIYIHNENFTAR